MLFVTNSLTPPRSRYRPISVAPATERALAYPETRGSTPRTHRVDGRDSDLERRSAPQQTLSNEQSTGRRSPRFRSPAIGWRGSPESVRNGIRLSELRLSEEEIPVRNYPGPDSEQDGRRLARAASTVSQQPREPRRVADRNRRSGVLDVHLNSISNIAI